ncbi:MAG TPA: hypothetical protein VGS96_04385 [Thermoanaerobaculia bacterium]|jgi:DNA-binding XRE family transcriptional regulator|nr:hypothetical protein [Thermoanaerobaculia bacterium]
MTGGDRATPAAPSVLLALRIARALGVTVETIFSLDSSGESAAAD